VPLEFDGACKPSRPGADYQYIEDTGFLHTWFLTQRRKGARTQKRSTATLRPCAFAL